MGVIEITCGTCVMQHLCERETRCGGNRDHLWDLCDVAFG